MGWVSPDWPLHVLLVGHAILDWILDVGWVLSQSLVVSFLREVSDSEWTKSRRIMSIVWFLSEIFVTAVGSSEWVEGAVLEHTGGVRLIFI